MNFIQQLAALITVSTTGFYFVMVMIRLYKMFKVNEEEIKKEAKEVVEEVVTQAEKIKEDVEKKIQIPSKKDDGSGPPTAQS